MQLPRRKQAADTGRAYGATVTQDSRTDFCRKTILLAFPQQHALCALSLVAKGIIRPCHHVIRSQVQTQQLQKFFRAAAGEQLAIWGERVEVPVIRHAEGADPSAVIYDAIQSAKAKNMDVLICDTAGRLQNKKNLMDELAKMNKVISREWPEAARENLLVLDATTGKNAVSQVSEFGEAANITGIVLTKLDGTAKGGIVLTIADEFNMPVKFVGLGEGIEDLEEFDPQDFAKGIFE